VYYSASGFFLIIYVLSIASTSIKPGRCS